MKDATIQLISTRQVLRTGLKEYLRSVATFFTASSLSKETIRNILIKNIDILLVDLSVEEVGSAFWIKKILKKKDILNGDIAIILLADINSQREQEIWYNLPLKKHIQNVFWYTKVDSNFYFNLKFTFHKTLETLRYKRLHHISQLMERTSFISIQKEYLQKNSSNQEPVLPWILRGKSTHITSIIRTIKSNLKNYTKKYPLTLIGSLVCHKYIVSYIYNLLQKENPKNNGNILYFDFNQLPSLFHRYYLLGFEHIENKILGKEEESIFLQASQGIIILQNIDTLNYHNQQLLLSILKNKQIPNLSKPIDCVVVISIDRDLESLVKKSSFSQSLFSHIYTLPIVIPKLEQRLEDVWDIIHTFPKFTDLYKDSPFIFDADVVDILCQYQWFNGYQELIDLVNNLVSSCQHLIILNKSDKFVINKDILLLFLEKFLQKSIHKQEKSIQNKQLYKIYKEHVNPHQLGLFSCLEDENLTLEELENNYISYIVSYHKGNLSEAARVLKVTRKTLYNRLAKYKDSNL